MRCRRICETSRMPELKRPAIRIPRVPSRAVALGVPAAAMAALGFQAWYVGHRNLPAFDELDPTTTVGDLALPRVRMTLVGDSSITAPGLDDPEDIWIRQVARRLSTTYCIDIVNHAVSGARVRDVVERQLAGATAERGDVAIVSVGANDALRGTPMSRLETLLTEAVTELRTCHSVVVLAGVGDLGDCPRLPFPLGAIAGERCRVANAIHTRVAAELDGVIRAPLREVSGDAFRDPSMFSPDLFHPNAQGHAVWARAAFPVVATAVTQALRERAAIS